MATRIDVGRPLGVTKPSIVPATMNASASPSAITAERRPCSASASVRVRSPGSTIAQPTARPGAAGHDDRGELEQAVREDQPVELRLLPDRREQAGRLADVGAVGHEDERGGDAQEDPGGEREEAHLDVVHRDLGGELRRPGPTSSTPRSPPPRRPRGARPGADGLEGGVGPRPATRPSGSPGTNSSSALTTTNRRRVPHGGREAGGEEPGEPRPASASGCRRARPGRRRPGG